MLDGASAQRIANGGVDTSTWRNAVTSAKIVDGEIVTADLADDSVTSAKIVDGAIVLADLADGLRRRARRSSTTASPPPTSAPARSTTTRSPTARS